MRSSDKFDGLALSRGFCIKTTDHRYRAVQKTDPGCDKSNSKIEAFAQGMQHEHADPVICPKCEGWGLPINRKKRPIRTRGDCPRCHGTGHQFAVSPLLPTDFLPGSWQKQAVLQARRALGSFLWIAGDRRSAEGMPQRVPDDPDEIDDDEDDAEEPDYLQD